MSKEKPKFLESVPKNSTMYLVYSYKMEEATYLGYSVKTRTEEWYEWPTVGHQIYTVRDFVVKFKSKNGKKFEIVCDSNDNLLSNDPRNKWDNNEHQTREVYFTSDVNLLAAYIKDSGIIDKVQNRINNLEEEIKSLMAYSNILKTY